MSIVEDKGGASANAGAVAAFYDAVTEPFSALFDGSVHAGYCGSGATNIVEAQAHLNDEIFDACALRPGQNVLDAGCGAGGPAIQAARCHDVHVTGVTLSPRQAAAATAHAARAGVTSVEFTVGDIVATPFPDGSFDTVYAIESVLFHVEDKAEAFSEFARVLRPGGTLVIADYVLREPMSQEDIETAEQALCAVPLVPADQVKETVERAGFDRVWIRTMTEEVRPSGPMLVDVVRQRREQLLAVAGEEGLAGATHASRLYTGLFVSAQDYVLLRAEKPAG